MSGTCILLTAVATILAACRHEPTRVYVPLTEPEVELLVRASATDVAAGQCWLTRPPPAHEEEVADNVRWEAHPAEGARFDTGWRDDHAREVVFAQAGTYVLGSSSSMWCRPGEAVKGQSTTIVVRPARAIN